MPRISLAFFTVAAACGLAGMAWGSYMGASHDHSMMQAHAHLNLLGWVSLFLFGIYYRLNPALDGSRLALVQVGVWSVGTVVLTLAVMQTERLTPRHSTEAQPRAVPVGQAG